MHIHFGIFRINWICLTIYDLVAQNLSRIILSRDINQGGTAQSDQQDNNADEIEVYLRICDFPFHFVQDNQLCGILQGRFFRHSVDFRISAYSRKAQNPALSENQFPIVTLKYRSYSHYFFRHLHYPTIRRSLSQATSGLLKWLSSMYSQSHQDQHHVKNNRFS